VARTVAQQIKATLTPQEQSRLASARPVNPEAYEAFLRGRYFLSRWPEGAEMPAKYFQEAIDKDPNYGEAWAGLATSTLLLGYFDPPHQSFPKAKAAAERALLLNPSLGEAYVALGDYKSLYEYDWGGRNSITSAQSSLAPAARTPTLITAPCCSARLGSMRRSPWPTGGQEVDPVGLLANRMLGFVYMWARRYDDSIVQNQKTLELDPNHDTARFQLAGCYTLLGKYAEALAEFKKLGDITAHPHVGFLYAVSGRHSAARKIASDLERLSKQEYISPFMMAVPYAGLRDHDKAIEWLERGYHEHAAMMFLLKVDPFLDNVRSDPRFQDLLRRMNFPP